MLVVVAQSLVYVDASPTRWLCFLPLLFSNTSLKGDCCVLCCSWMVGFGSGSPNQVWHKLSYNTRLTYPLAGKTIYSAGESVGGLHL